MRREFTKGVSLALLFAMCLTGCGTGDGFTEAPSMSEETVVETTKETSEPDTEQTTEESEAVDMKEVFDQVKLTKAIKGLSANNPLMTQRLGADPYVIVYDDTVYVYMTADEIEYDAAGNVKDNSYSKIHSLNVISSKDLVNWTDHGSIIAAGKDGASNWGNNSWAPAVCYREVDGQTKFFIYFANGGNGIGVITSDSPTGPFVDPLGKALISRSTPNCANVEWLFDPAVLVDGDRAFLYFGGGVPSGKTADPGTARVVELADDMISIKGEPQRIDVPYLFEDSGINRIGDTYYYSYCSNWNVDAEAEKELGFSNAQIVVMTSDDPMGPFTLQGPILKNPGTYFGCYGNNHHCIFEFNGKYYIAYHSQILESELGIKGGYRCTHIDEVTVNEDGSIAMGKGTLLGVEQVGTLNPYEVIDATTMATMGGLSTTQYGEQSEQCGSGNMIVTDIHEGDWLVVKGADFGEDGASKFLASIRSNGNKGYIKICLDSAKNDAIGYIVVDGSVKDFESYCVDLSTTVTGVHDIFLVFAGEGFEIDNWQFSILS